LIGRIYSLNRRWTAISRWNSPAAEDAETLPGGYEQRFHSEETAKDFVAKMRRMRDAIRCRGPLWSLTNPAAARE